MVAHWLFKRLEIAFHPLENDTACDMGLQNDTVHCSDMTATLKSGWGTNTLIFVSANKLKTKRHNATYFSFSFIFLEQTKTKKQGTLSRHCPLLFSFLFGQDVLKGLEHQKNFF